MSTDQESVEIREPASAGFAGLLSGGQPEQHQQKLERAGYEHLEWTVRGFLEEEPFETIVTVVRPKDPAVFSGVVIAEPLHVYGISTLWDAAGDYAMRSGHGWVVLGAQKVPLVSIITPSDPDRYRTLQLPSIGPTPSFVFPFDGSEGEDERRTAYWDALDAYQPSMIELIGRLGRAVRSHGEEIFGRAIDHMVLCGVSENGQRTTNFLRTYGALDRSIFNGYLPAAFPLDAIEKPPAPVIQVIFEGDISSPLHAYRPGYEGRRYRRDDSDTPGDQYRLYEIAGASHGDMRSLPAEALVAMVPTLPAGIVTPSTRLNSVPYNELLTAALHHLIAWVSDGTTPPRAPRLEVASDGSVAQDANGNSLGGVRSPELDVPVATHRASAPDPRHAISYLTFGIDEVFPPEKLRALYGDEAGYISRYRARLDELVEEGWLLEADAAQLAAAARFPDTSTRAG